MGKKSKQAKIVKEPEQQNLIGQEQKEKSSGVQTVIKDSLHHHHKKHKQEKKQFHIKVDNTYCWEEIEMHDTKNDIWVVVGQGVYNVTNLVDNHPGGQKVILDKAGKDATEAFHDGNHPQRVIKKALPKLCIGKVDKESASQSYRRQAKSGKVDCFIAFFLTLAILIFMGFLVVRQ